MFPEIATSPFAWSFILAGAAGVVWGIIGSVLFRAPTWLEE